MGSAHRRWEVYGELQGFVLPLTIRAEREFTIMRTAIGIVLFSAAILAGCTHKTTEVSTAAAPTAAQEVAVSYEAGATTQAKQTAANRQCQEQYGVGLGVFMADDWAGHATYACTKA